MSKVYIDVDEEKHQDSLDEEQTLERPTFHKKIDYFPCP